MSSGAHTPTRAHHAITRTSSAHTPAGNRRTLELADSPPCRCSHSLDVDAALTSDVYALLHAPPLSLQDVLVSDNAEEDAHTAAGLNC
eukprot:6555430-Prymnesium_polylepis.2